MSYRYLITGVLNGTMVGIGLAVGSYLSSNSVGAATIKTGLGVTAGLVLAGYVSYQEIQRTQEALKQLSVEESSDYLLQESIGTADTTKQSQMIAGLSPLSGMAITLFPVVFQNVLLSPFHATLGAVLVGSSFLFAFGIWLSLETHRPWFILAPRLAAFGLLTAVVSIIMP